MHRIGVVGAGAWGTALACQARRAGRDVVLWARRPEVAALINGEHANPVYLPHVTIDPGIRATTDLAEAADADLVLLVVPSQHLRAVAGRAAAVWRDGTPAVVCAKGIEQGTLALMSEVVGEVLPDIPVTVLSGPSFGAELARGLPTAVTFAAAAPDLEAAVPMALGTSRFRIYSTDDVTGVQIGGAVKNVLAIACGIVHGRRLGDNARAALITRGLAEMSRLAMAKGARPETLMGLSGLGDLVLTCNAMQSRNFSLGVALGTGRAMADVLAERAAVTEGVFSAASVSALARRLGVEMPICFAADAVLNGGAHIDATISELLARPFRTEQRPAMNQIKGSSPNSGMSRSSSS